MKLWELKSKPGARKDKKRVGRGGSRGTTSGKGSKGQNARSGGGKGRGFEGGQTPWYRRLPKFRGFKSLNPKEFQIINLKDLAKFSPQEEITPETLKQKGLIKNLNKPVKLLGDGEIEGEFTVKIHRISQKAREQIEAKGGKVEVIS